MNPESHAHHGRPVIAWGHVNVVDLVRKRIAGVRVTTKVKIHHLFGMLSTT